MGIDEAPKRADSASARFAGDERPQAEGSGDRVAELAATFPRILIAEGLAEDLARDWTARADAAEADGKPAIPRYPFSDSVRQGLFEARRARRVVRGLEGVQAALESESAGLDRAPATRTSSGKPRISRLLVLSSDGAPRFYRAAEQLRARFASRLALVIVDCDERALGGAVFGGGRRARALMLDHKEAVIEFLLILDEIREAGRQGEDSI